MTIIDKINLMVRLKERIYEIRNDLSKREEVVKLTKLLQRISNTPDVKYI